MINPIYAIGDVHGCFDEAKCAVQAIENYHLNNKFSDNPRIIWLGDLTDRGPQSREVVELVMSRGDECVMGNHDHAMFASCKTMRYITPWMKWGGATTLASYGHDQELLQSVIQSMINGEVFDPNWVDTSVIPTDHVDWLSKLPTKIETKNHFFCHAGIDPNTPFDKQDDYTLMWIRDEFLDHKKTYPKLVVHGHSIIGHSDRHKNPKNRVNLDHGAYYSGNLCIGVFDDNVKGGKLIEKIIITKYG